MPQFDTLTNAYQKKSFIFFGLKNKFIHNDFCSTQTFEKTTENLTAIPFLNKIPACTGTRIFITAFAQILTQSSYASILQALLSVRSLHCNHLTLSYYLLLDLSSGLLSTLTQFCKPFKSNKHATHLALLHQHIFSISALMHEIISLNAQCG